MFDFTIKNAIEAELSDIFGRSILINDFKPVTGGCINEAGKLDTNIGMYFVKWNNAKKFPEMFKKEADGLQLLKSSNSIYVPDFIASGSVGNYLDYLILEYIETEKRTNNFWTIFGEQLASLHKNTNESFGLSYSNFIGSLEQNNEFSDNWNSFFIARRIEPQVKLARDHSMIDKSLAKKFERLYSKLDEIFPVEQPALIHGDLWSGNFLINKEGLPCLIDPAIYYGHREMDLSFSLLFGGFEKEFYRAYEENYALQPGFNNRIDYYNLYPLMVHVNLFGGGYINSVKSILKSFSVLV